MVIEKPEIVSNHGVEILPLTENKYLPTDVKIHH
jgi:hypothetical protein